MRRLPVVLLVVLACVGIGAEVACATPLEASTRGAAPTAKAQKRKACKLKRHAKCRKTVVSGQKVGKVNLKGIKLQGAKVTGTTFKGTDLRRASFKGATLRHVTFKDAKLGAATFKGAVLVDVRFEGVDFTAPASRCEMIPAPASSARPGQLECDSTGEIFIGSNVKSTAFVRCNLSRSDWQSARIDNVLFSDDSLDGANFDDTRWSRGSLIVGNGPVAHPTASARAANFDGASGVVIASRVDIAFASFVGATGASIDPDGALRRGVHGIGDVPGSLSIDFLEPSGMVGGASVVVAEESRVDEQHQWGWKVCTPATGERCGTTRGAVIGGLGYLSLWSGTALKAVGPGVECGAPQEVHRAWRTECYVEIGADTTVAVTAASTPVRTISVERPSLGDPPPAVWIHAYRFQTTADAYAATCPGSVLGTCSLEVPRGAHVRVESRASGWLTIDCPGDPEAYDTPLAAGVLYRCPEMTVSGDASGTVNAS